MSQFTLTRSTLSSQIAGGIALILLAVLVAAPWWASSSFLRLVGEFAVYLALATLWNLLAGYTGLVSVGQQAYVGLGGYITFSLALFLGVHPLVAIPLAGLGAAVVAIPVASLVFRLQGAYFAIGYLGDRRSVPPDRRADDLAGWWVGHQPAGRRDQDARRQMGARGVDLLACPRFERRLSGLCLSAAALTHRACPDRDPGQ